MIYGQDAEDRIVLEIDASLAPGDSGAALVNIDGQVVGMVFAVTRRGPRHQGFALDLVEIAQFLAEIDRVPLPTPPCSTQ